MIRHIKVFLVFLVLNTMIASIYLVWGVIRSSERGQWKNYLFKAEVMLFCPGVGPMFFFVSNLIYKIFFRKAVDLADVIFSKERVTTFKRADIEAEGNLVPIEEALVVSDKGSQRALLLKVARGDIHNSLASISLALNSDDSETAHYAAAVLQDALNDFRLKVQELYEHMEEDEEDAPEYAALMIEYMNNMLSQSVFDELEQKKYIGMMEEAGEVLYQKAKEKLTAIYIECICLRLLQAMEYDRMEVWCGRSRELHPDVLSTYTLQLKLYFTIQDKQKFFQVLNALKQSDIVIDRDTLALIRAFYESDGEKKTVAAENSSEEKTTEKTVEESVKKTDKNENVKNENIKNEAVKDESIKSKAAKDETAKRKDIKESENRAEEKQSAAGIAAAVLAGAEKAKDIKNVEEAVLKDTFEKAESAVIKAEQDSFKKAESTKDKAGQSISQEINLKEVKVAQSESQQIQPEEIKVPQNASQEIQSEEAKVSQSTSQEIQPEEAKVPQSTSKEIQPEEAKVSQNASQEIQPEEAKVPQSTSKEIKSKEAKALQNIFEEIEQEQAEAAQSSLEETKSEEAKALQSIFEEIEQEQAEAAQSIFEERKQEKSAAAQNAFVERKSEELITFQNNSEDVKLTEEAVSQNISEEETEPAKETVSQNISEKTKLTEEPISYRTSEEAELTKTMVSDIIGDLMAENAATEDINAQINQIIAELITENEAREKEDTVVRRTSPAHDRQISDEKKIDVLKTIARKHKIWALLGLSIVIAAACLLIYMKNKKNKEE